MLRTLALAVAVSSLALAGCPRSSEPSSGDPAALPEGTPPVVATAAPQPEPPATPPPDPTAAAPGTAATAPGTAATAPGPAATEQGVGAPKQDGGRLAKPGWCDKDGDCGPGKVCESCAAEKCCVQGCRADAQCASGEACRAVQCVRAPCPSQCMKR